MLKKIEVAVVFLALVMAGCVAGENPYENVDSIETSSLLEEDLPSEEEYTNGAKEAEDNPDDIYEEKEEIKEEIEEEPLLEEEVEIVDIGHSIADEGVIIEKDFEEYPNEKDVSQELVEVEEEIIIEEVQEPVIKEIVNETAKVSEEVKDEEVFEPHPTAYCQDTDADSQYPDGINLFKRGQIIINGKVVPSSVDLCATPSDVLEWHCNGKLSRLKRYKCPGSCLNGECV
jgi:hypothetical protein